MEFDDGTATELYLPTEEARDYLAKRGFPRTTSCWNRWAVDGNGPRYVRPNGGGPRLYPVSELTAFLRERIGEPSARAADHRRPATGGRDDAPPAPRVRRAS